MYSISMMSKTKESFERAFQPTEPKSKKKSKPCRIKIDGKFVKTWSGKSIWAAKGHAKLALRSALGHRFNQQLCEELGIPHDFTTTYYSGYRRETLERYYKEFLEKAQQEGYIEFVEVDE